MNQTPEEASSLHAVSQATLRYLPEVNRSHRRALAVMIEDLVLRGISAAIPDAETHDSRNTPNHTRLSALSALI